MKKILLIGTVLSLLVCSCASLTKSQVETVHQFAKTSKDFSAYPSEILTAMADLRVKRGVYYTNSLENTDDQSNDDDIDSLNELAVTSHVQELNDIYKAKKDDYRASEKINITFKIIDKYAQSLLLLSSDKHAADLGTQAGNFGVSLDSLINKYNTIQGVKPVRSGIGGLIGSLIMAGGKQLIRAKQAKEIQRFVPAADEMIGVMTGNLLEFLQSTGIDALIKNEETGIQSNYRSFLRHRKPYIQNEWDYVDLLTHLDRVKKLRDQTTEATKGLRKAHGELLTVVKEKKTLTELIAGLQVFYEDVNEVKNTVQALNTAKK